MRAGDPYNDAIDIEYPAVVTWASTDPPILRVDYTADTSIVTVE